MPILAAKKELTALLAILLLLANSLWLGHLYHDHDLDHDESCEICFISHALEKIVKSESLGQPWLIHRFYLAQTPHTPVRFVKVSHYLSRAPPFSS